MWTGYYPMEEKHDLAQNCGMLLFEMDNYEDALLFYERSQNLDEANSTVLYHMAICYDELGIEDSARQYAHRAIAIEPEHEGALSLLSVL
ncbi:Tetratricopeptide repeat protein [compost metagenome]